MLDITALHVVADAEAQTLVWCLQHTFCIALIYTTEVADWNVVLRVFLELCDPNFLHRTMTVAQVIANNTVLSLLCEKFLLHFVFAVEHDKLVLAPHLRVKRGCVVMFDGVVYFENRDEVRDPRGLFVLRPLGPFLLFIHGCLVLLVLLFDRTAC